MDGGGVRSWGAKNSSLPKICHIYPTMMKLGSYTLPRKEPKNILITGNPRILLYQGTFNSFKLFRVFKDFFNKHDYNFDDVSKYDYSSSS